MYVEKTIVLRLRYCRGIAPIEGTERPDILAQFGVRIAEALPRLRGLKVVLLQASSSAWFIAEALPRLRGLKVCAADHVPYSNSG